MAPKSKITTSPVLIFVLPVLWCGDAPFGSGPDDGRERVLVALPGDALPDRKGHFHLADADLTGFISDRNERIRGLRRPLQGGQFQAVFDGPQRRQGRPGQLQEGGRHHLLKS